MINIFQNVYFANYWLNIFQSIACIIILFFLVKSVSKPLIQKAGEIQKKKIKLSMIYSILAAFGISLGPILLIAFLGWFSTFFRLINNIYFTFALITTINLPFYLKNLNDFNKRESLLNPPKIKKKIIKRHLFLIIVSWIVVALFISIDLLGIEMGNLIPDDPISINYDIFLLGFQWAFFALLIYSILTKVIILLVIPLEKRPPKNVIANSRLFGSILAFLVWSLQLIIVELYLSRALNITLYQQDIRVLLIVVALIYTAGFLISMKYMYLPKAIEEDKKIIKEKNQSMKEEMLKYKDDDVILNVKDLVTYFYTEEGIVHAVDSVSFKIYQGEVLGLVGETGCGKSVTALSILQLIQTPGKILSGIVEFEGENLLDKQKSEILTYRGNKITMIFQDPLNSLNPVFTVGKQISETYLLHKKKELLVQASESDKSIYAIAREWGIQLLTDLNIPSPKHVIDQYPYELSGGMRQRIQIAMGIAGSPRLLIADEPTTALDVTIQNQILKLMKDLKKKHNTSILFITHDLAIISKMCDRVAIMYCGSIVENGTTKKLFTKPYHPYTKGLLSAVPIEGKEDDKLTIIPGMVPNLIYPPSGCRFHPRCSNRFTPCDREKPKNVEVEANYFVACHLYDAKYKNKNEEPLK